MHAFSLASRTEMRGWKDGPTVPGRFKRIPRRSTRASTSRHAERSGIDVRC